MGTVTTMIRSDKELTEEERVLLRDAWENLLDENNHGEHEDRHLYPLSTKAQVAASLDDLVEGGHASKGNVPDPVDEVALAGSLARKGFGEVVQYAFTPSGFAFVANSVGRIRGSKEHEDYMAELGELAG